MAGRFTYILIAGGAVVAGMFLQGDININGDKGHVRIGEFRSGDDEDRVARRVEERVDRQVDRAVDRATQRETVRDEDAIKREMADAVGELVRAEGSLITARLDENMPAAAIKQTEARRDAAREAVERLSQEAKAISAEDRGAIRESIRDSVREAVRS